MSEAGHATFAGDSAAPFPGAITSPLAKFPNAACATNRNLLRSILESSHSHLDDRQPVTSSDAIARNYSHTALGLTMAKLRSILEPAPKQSLIRSAARAGTAAVPSSPAAQRSSARAQAAAKLGVGSPLAAVRAAKGSGPALVCDKPSPARAARVSNYTMNVSPIPRRDGGFATPAGLHNPLNTKVYDTLHELSIGHTEWTFEVEDVESKGADAAGGANAEAGDRSERPLAQEEFLALNAAGRARMLEVVSQDYLEVVRSMPTHTMPAWSGAWEAGILRRLGVMDQPLRAWDSLAPRLMHDATWNPADVVTQATAEAEENYRCALQRAMVDYALRSPSPRDHYGLPLFVLESARWVPAPALAPQALDISSESVPRAALAFITRAHVTEPVLQKLWNLWWRSESEYHDLALVPCGTADWRAQLPLTLPDAKSAFYDVAHDARGTLKQRWHTDSVELVAGFVLDLQAIAEGDQSAVADPAAEDFIHRLAAFDYLQRLSLGTASSYNFGQRDAVVTRGSLRADSRGSLLSQDSMRMMESALEEATGEDKAGAVDIAVLLRTLYREGAAAVKALWPTEGPRAMGRRLHGVFRAGAQLLSNQLIARTLHSVSEFHGWMQWYQSEQALALSVNRDAGRAPGASLREDESALAMPPPAIVLRVVLRLGEGEARGTGSSLGAVGSAGASANQTEADAEAAADDSAGTGEQEQPQEQTDEPAGDADADDGEDSDGADSTRSRSLNSTDAAFNGLLAGASAADARVCCNVHAQDAADVDFSGAPPRGQHAAHLWAGTVSLAWSPSIEEVTQSLQEALGAAVRCSHGIARLQHEITQDDDIDEAGLSDADSSDEDLPADQCLPGLPLEDNRVQRAIAEVDTVVQAHLAGPAELLASYESFEYLFSAGYRKHIVQLCAAESTTVGMFMEQITQLEQVSEAVEQTTPDSWDFGLFTVSTSLVKAALKARVRALQTVLIMQLKTNVIASLRVINLRYEWLSQQLLSSPRSAADVVTLKAMINTCFSDMALIKGLITDNDGVAAQLALLYRLISHTLMQHTELARFALGQPGDTASAGEPAPFQLLDSEGVPLTRPQGLAVKEMLQWPAKLQDCLETAHHNVNTAGDMWKSQTEQDASVLEALLDSVRGNLDKLGDESAMHRVIEATRRAERIAADLEKAHDIAEDVNSRQASLGVTIQNFTTRISEYTVELKPLASLWSTVSEYLDSYKAWYTGPLRALSPDAAEKTGEALRAASMRARKDLPDKASGPLAVAEKVQRDVSHFLQDHLPLLTLLANPGIKSRHWDDLDRITGRALPRDEATPLSEFLKLGLSDMVEAMEETCINAKKEHSLEKALATMQTEWEPVALELKAYKATGTYVLTSASADELQALLDDHTVKAQTMAASRFAKPLLEGIRAWVAKLQRLQAVLDGWLKVQSQWLYLEPIFSSEDIMRQMPVEGQQFKQVDRKWRAVMQGAVQNPAGLAALDQPGILDRLNTAAQLLEQISKGLNAYLETKRLYFPRFFFLSNDELLEILAETKDPLRVQRHLKKCFDGIAALHFEPNLDITAMISAEGERVELSEEPDGGRINPKAAHGNVEIWLVQVEAAMRRTVACVCDSAIVAYGQAEQRAQWAVQWPGQAVLAASQRWWTQDVERAIRAERPGALQAYAEQCDKQLQDIIMLVRGQLTKLQRQTLSALVVLDVHARDVTAQVASAGVQALHDFEWNSQLRYYWTDDGVSAKTGDPHSLRVRMINSGAAYANEYLGNSPRLVITPLTDRCYRTLIGAIHLNLGGAPEGPAGTGKTETTKDLAKALAIQCVVYNCSDQLDYKAMAKFFKGLAASGAWACFDEFNRIELEVLSVIAQQILTIQLAKRAGMEIFTFEGTELPLRTTANVFITMNPGYAGRSELPDNLKALFRSVAMMVPDYALIATIILYSFGYLEAKPMAKKIVATYRLCSEQLSSQDHYDYGMRAVMAVLRAAGNLKRAEPGTPEAELVLRSIVDVNLPKFLAHDIPLFNGIVSDLFPGVQPSPPDRSALQSAMETAAASLGLQCTPYLQDKTLQVYEMMLVRHGFMLVGMPWSGKTASVDVLRGAMEQLCAAAETQQQSEHGNDQEGGAHAELESTWKRIVPVVLFPKAITMAELYGANDALTQEWADGILSTAFRAAAEGKTGPPGARVWVTFDGPVDAIWIENMNTVLDDNKKLCLMSGEIIAMSDLMSMVFETKDLAAASPATVSRCGMVYYEPAEVGWRPLVRSWLDRHQEDNPDFPARPADLSSVSEAQRAATPDVLGGARDPRAITLNAEQTAAISRLCELVLDPVLVWLKKDAPPSFAPVSDISMVVNSLRLFEGFASQALQAGAAAAGAGSTKKASANPKLAGQYQVGALTLPGCLGLTGTDVQGLLLTCLAWCIGSVVHPSHRGALLDMIAGICAEPGSVLDHPYAAFIQLAGWTEAAAGVKDGPVSSCWKAGDPAMDMMFVPGDQHWRKWADALPSEVQVQGAEALVPVIASAQFERILASMTRLRYHTLVVGPTGTGKTAYMKQFLLETLPNTEWLPIFVGFSARTSAKATQIIVDNKLERRRKGVYGPRPGFTAVVFVDDLNLPEPETYGAQPPLELLRQMLDKGGWYNTSECSFRQFESSMMVAAMGPPGGGRHPISPRLLRQFVTVCFPEFSGDTLTRIFSAIISSFMAGKPFEHEVTSAASSVVTATKAMYEAAIEALRPTPAKSHYTFNLRDFARVIAGITLATPVTLASSDALARLWMHECERVFADRLVDDNDAAWYFSTMSDMLSRHFGKKLTQLCEHLPEFRQGVLNAATGSEGMPESEVTPSAVSMVMWGTHATKTGEYGEVLDAGSLLETLTDAMTEFNAMSKSRLDLVLFPFFVRHVSRTLRVLALPGAHALLVGVGGSGRTSSTRLACHLADAVLRQIELTKSYGVDEWRDDLRSILGEAGTSDRPVTLLFNDTQIKWEGMVEDLSNVLNTGEVPGLFAADEQAELLERVAGAARSAGLGKDASPADLWAFFVRRVRMNLHIILAMSPIGDAFRDRLRKFPSLVNCCTINWFSAWPADALQAVATKQLSTVSGIALCEGDDTGTVLRKQALRASLADVCQRFHNLARLKSEQFASELKRHNYVTPTSFLELLSQFRRSLGERRADIDGQRLRYEAGLQQLEAATLAVQSLQDDLTALQPVLQQSQVEADELMTAIEAKLPSVQETRAAVQAEADIANADAQVVQGQKDECEADLAVAMPILESAIAALDTLTKDDFNLVKSFQNPPNGVRVSMAAVCVMLNEKPDKVKDPAGGMKKIDDYWGPGKRLLGDTKAFMARLKDYDKDNIPARIIGKIRAEYISDPEFAPERVAQAAKAAAGMASWVHALSKYDEVAKVVAPKKAALADAEESLAVKMGALREKQSALAAVEADLQGLQDQFDTANARKADLERQVQDCRVKLERAQALIAGLGGEKSRWTAAAESLAERLEALTGDVLMAAGALAYAAAFTPDYRLQLFRSWAGAVRGAGMRCSGEPGSGSTFSVAETLGDPIAIREWRLQGLPTDSFSTDNGVMVWAAMQARWPLMIDPQGQANKWVRNMELSTGLKVTKQTDADMLRTLENAIRFGSPVLLENVGEELDPALGPVLARQVFKLGGAPHIRLGDTNVEYDPAFKLYITTKLRNPHYLPEVATRVSLINFMITPPGLSDQLLGRVVEEERPDLAEARVQLLVSRAENAAQLKKLEDQILAVLSQEGSILEDESAVKVLNDAKDLSAEIQAKQQAAEATEAAIEEARSGYEPVAAHATLLFFCIADLGAVDPMYQYSLEWFMGLFTLSIKGSKRSDNMRVRIAAITEHFTSALYRNVCRSLFEQHKLMFSFLMTARLLAGRGDVDEAEWRFLLTGGVGIGENPHPNPAPTWLQDRSWDELCRLSELPVFQGLQEDIAASPRAWQAMYDSEQPHEADIPGQWGSLGFLTRLQKLLILRGLRPDKLIAGIRDFVGGTMGAEFLQPPAFDLAACYADSAAIQPLIFVLSPGSDPMAALLAYAEQRGQEVQAISLGQGQGVAAEALIESARQQGSWVVLQNCHLATSWMPRLERICESFGDRRPGAPPPPHEHFRLWCTSYPTPHFPVSMLQNGVKMTNEAPRGLRNNLIRTYLNDPISSPEWFGSIQNAQRFQRMLFGLAFFHALVQERREYGPLGWNVPYEFNDSDMRISVQQLAMFLDDGDYCPREPGESVSTVHAVPFTALRYLTGECNYGGRVTDDKDRRCLLAILGQCYSEAVHQSNFALSESGQWRTAPAEADGHAAYVEFIQGLPSTAAPEVVGLHANADLAKDQRETNALLDALLTTERSGNGTVPAGQQPATEQPVEPAGLGDGSESHLSEEDVLGRGSCATQDAPGAAEAEQAGAAVQSRDAMIHSAASDILAKLPQQFDVEAVSAAYPVKYEESMNTVLLQECARYNRLLAVVRSSLESLQKAMAGLVLLSAQLEELGDDLFYGRIPGMWAARSYPSLKPLGGYLADLIERLGFLQNWIDHGKPSTYWLPGLFFPQAFLTGTLQNYARAHTVPIDAVHFDVVMSALAPEKVTAPPASGTYVHGAYFDGARWDGQAKSLAESAPKQLFPPVPLLWLQPEDRRQRDTSAVDTRYACPVYKTTERRGILSTTGHSTNFVMWVPVPTASMPADHWIRRGVAMVLSLDA